VALTGLRIGELLVKMQLLKEGQLEEALKYQRQFGGKIGEALVHLGFVTEKDILQGLSKKFRCPLR